jgi:ABC-type phosphate/phosphonate transport system substrate-binding protein
VTKSIGISASTILCIGADIGFARPFERTPEESGVARQRCNPFSSIHNAPHPAAAAAWIGCIRSEAAAAYRQMRTWLFRRATTRAKGDNMNLTTRGTALTGSVWLVLLLVLLGASGSSLAQKIATKAVVPQSRIVLAINEGGAANADSTETLFRYQEFTEIVEKALHTQVVIVAVRDRNRLRNALKNHEYPLLLARPNDVPAEAIRDYGYQPIVAAKEPSQALFIVAKNSTLKTIADVKGKTIVTPDQYSNMWRVANAMLRDAKITMANEQVKAMRDQAAIGWSMENNFYDVGVVNSVSGVARSWEKNGGRVIARSRELPNMPMIASPQIPDEQVLKIRAALIALDSSESGKAILKKIGLTGFQYTPAKVFVDFLDWLGDLEAAKNAGQL